MNFGLIVLIMGVVVLSVYAIRCMIITDRFRKECKVGDTCVFYDDEERIVGEIISKGQSSVVVYAFDRPYHREITEIYPI